MKVELTRYVSGRFGRCNVTREKDDPRIYSGGWGRDESILLYQVKQALINQGHDVIKKLAWKDGHMVADTLHYLRSRNPKKPGGFQIWDSRYAVRNTAQEFNKGMIVDFDVEYF
jgi:hypothetical protein